MSVLVKLCEVNKILIDSLINVLSILCHVLGYSVCVCAVLCVHAMLWGCVRVCLCVHVLLSGRYAAAAVNMITSGFEVYLLNN